MPIYLGTQSVTVKLGAEDVTGYLGSVSVTVGVPGAPVITSLVQTPGFGTEMFYSPPASNGGSEITEYKFYSEQGEATPTGENVGVSAAFEGFYYTFMQVSAVNAIGEGPLSDPVTPS